LGAEATAVLGELLFGGCVECWADLSCSSKSVLPAEAELLCRLAEEDGGFRSKLVTGRVMTR